MAYVKLADIAAATGISISGVSKALADSPEISAQTRLRVQQTAAAMGYHSNTFARSLRLGSSKLIGVIIPSNDNPFYSGILQGISETLRTQGYSIIVTNSGDTMQGEHTALTSLLSIPVCGILTVPFSLANYRNVSQPLVFMSRYPYRAHNDAEHFLGDAEQNSYIVNDDFEGQRLATQYLIQRGFQKVFLLLDAVDPKSLGTYKALARLDGYRSACQAEGLPFDNGHIFMQIDSPDICYSTVKALCSENPGGGFAICATNDYISLAALAAIHESNLLIPEQVAVVGYDGIKWGAYYTPQLTTVQLANKEIGIYASQYLHMRLCSQDLPQLSTALHPCLLKRQTA